MRQGPGGRRPRGRPNRKQHGGPQRPNSFDSNGPEGRIRGSAHQVYEKYVGLARDALSGGDRVSAETYYQHAEHYFRIVNGSTDPDPNGRRAPDRNRMNGQGDRGGAAESAEASPEPTRQASEENAEPPQNDAPSESGERADGETAKPAEADGGQEEQAQAKAANGDAAGAPATPRRRSRQRRPREAAQESPEAGERDTTKRSPRREAKPAADSEATGT